MCVIYTKFKILGILVRKKIVHFQCYMLLLFFFFFYLKTLDYLSNFQSWFLNAYYIRKKMPHT